MFKKILLGVALFGLVAVLVFGAIQRTSAKLGTGDPGNYGIWTHGAREGQGQQGRGRSSWAGEGQETIAAQAGVTEQDTATTNEESPHLSIGSIVPGSLSAEEKDGLLFMIEEEKMARDVYLAMADLWGQPTFQNIASSEQAHLNAVKDLLVGYGIADPTVGKANGEFANTELQALYDKLVDEGSQSLSAALKVGAAIEEIDIRDLEAYVGQADDANILAVYANLERGSENHLRAFTRALARQTGETYVPQYLDAEKYQTIVTSSSANGTRGYRGGGNGRRP